MPSARKQGRTQRAVLWAYHSDDAYGTPCVSSPIELMVRWESTKTGLTGAATADKAASIAVIVDREIVIGGVFWLGGLDDLPVAPTDLMRVVDYKEVPDLKGRKIQRTALLAYLGDTLPTVVTT